MSSLSLAASDLLVLGLNNTSISHLSLSLSLALSPCPNVNPLLEKDNKIKNHTNQCFACCLMKHLQQFPIESVSSAVIL